MKDQRVQASENNCVSVLMPDFNNPFVTFLGKATLKKSFRRSKATFQGRFYLRLPMWKLQLLGTSTSSITDTAYARYAIPAKRNIYFLFNRTIADGAIMDEGQQSATRFVNKKNY